MAVSARPGAFPGTRSSDARPRPAGGGSDAGDGIEVDGLLDLGVEGVVPVVEDGALRGGDEAQVPLRLHQVVAPGQPTHHGQAGGRLDLRLAELQVPLAAHAVEDYAGHAQVGVELLVAEHLGGHAAGHLAGVGDQDHRGVQELGQLCGGTVLVQGRVAVEHAHDALDHGDVGGAGGPVEQLGDHGMGQQPGVQVAGGHAARDGVVRGVDVVGAGLEGLDPPAAAGQRAHDAAGDGGLAHAGANAGDDNGGGHITTLWSLMCACFRKSSEAGFSRFRDCQDWNHTRQRTPILKILQSGKSCF